MYSLIIFLPLKRTKYAYTKRTVTRKRILQKNQILSTTKIRILKPICGDRMNPKDRKGSEKMPEDIPRQVRTRRSYRKNPLTRMSDDRQSKRAWAMNNETEPKKIAGWFKMWLECSTSISNDLRARCMTSLLAPKRRRKVVFGFYEWRFEFYMRRDYFRYCFLCLTVFTVIILKVPSFPEKMAFFRMIFSRKLEGISAK